MYVSENYICFYSQFVKELVVIPFKDIILMKKESSSMGLSNCIHINARNQEVITIVFFFWC